MEQRNFGNSPVESWPAKSNPICAESLRMCDRFVKTRKIWRLAGRRKGMKRGSDQRHGHQTWRFFRSDFMNCFVSSANTVLCLYKYISIYMCVYTMILFTVRAYVFVRMTYNICRCRSRFANILANHVSSVCLRQSTIINTRKYTINI